MADRAWHARVAVRGVVALVAGAAAGMAIVPLLGIAAGLLGGWAVAAAVGAAWTLAVVWPMDPAQTRAHATSEDPGRRASRLIGVLGSVVSIAAVVVVLTQTHDAQGAAGPALAATALVSVAASWLLIQTVYIVRIADAYYSEPVGGIVFNQDEDPAYTDFAYVAFGVGLTYQVADTNVTTNRMRRVVIAQSLLGYLFGAVILGTVINLLAGL